MNRFPIFSVIRLFSFGLFLLFLLLNFSMFGQIQTIQKATGNNLKQSDILHLRMIPIYGQGGGPVFVTHIVVAVSSTFSRTGGKTGNTWDHVPQDLGVCIGKFKAPTDGKSLVGLGGDPRPDKDTVGGVAAEFGISAFLKAVPGTDHDDEHEETPENTEGRQQRPDTVLSNRMQDFLPYVHFKSYHHISNDAHFSLFIFFRLLHEKRIKTSFIIHHAVLPRVVCSQRAWQEIVLPGYLTGPVKIWHQKRFSGLLRDF